MKLLKTKPKLHNYEGLYVFVIKDIDNISQHLSETVSEKFVLDFLNRQSNPDSYKVLVIDWQKKLNTSNSQSCIFIEFTGIEFLQTFKEVKIYEMV